MIKNGWSRDEGIRHLQNLVDRIFKSEEILAVDALIKKKRGVGELF